MAFCFLTLNDNFDKECRPGVPSCNYYTDSVSTSSSHYNYFEEGPNTSDLQVNYSYCNKTTGYQCSSSSNSHQGNMLFLKLIDKRDPNFGITMIVSSMHSDTMNTMFEKKMFPKRSVKWLQQWSNYLSWWRHQMETSSALLAICAGNSPVPGEFPAQRPVTRSFDVFFDLRLNKRLSKQSWGWWFETLSRPWWYHRNVVNLTLVIVIYINTFEKKSSAAAPGGHFVHWPINQKGYFSFLSHHTTNPIVVMMPTLSSLTTPEVVIQTTSGAVNDDKVGIITIFSVSPPLHKPSKSVWHSITERRKQREVIT